MFENIFLGALLTLATTVMHALFTVGLIAFLRSEHVAQWAFRTRWSRVSVISVLVLLLFLLSVFEASLWAVAYVTVGAIQGLEEALYFSVVTFTTLGYGDITLGEDWRLLSSFQSANGVMIFGWTTALIVGVLQRMIFRDGDR